MLETSSHVKLVELANENRLVFWKDFYCYSDNGTNTQLIKSLHFKCIKLQWSHAHFSYSTELYFTLVWLLSSLLLVI